MSKEIKEQELRLSDRLEEQRSARDARRDYEYEARKRLYAECEPLVFEAMELARGALRRVVSLARSAGQAAIRPDGSGWLDRNEYYFKSTTFLLLAPTTTSKILQRRLTQIDLSLEPRLRMQYELLKLLFFTFTDSHELASLPPTKQYEPDRADPGMPDREGLLREQAGVYQRQGFYLAVLEVVAERLITPTEGASRCKSYGEFLTELDDPTSGINALLGEFQGVFGGFHPLRLPVLWRVLITQSVLYEALLRSPRWPEKDLPKLSALVDLAPPQDLSAYDWRSPSSDVPDGVVREPFEVARVYLTKKLALLDQQLRS